jgi:hypothetical protein
MGNSASKRSIIPRAGAKILFLSILLLIGYVLRGGDLTKASLISGRDVPVFLGPSPGTKSRTPNDFPTRREQNTGTIFLYEKNMKTGSTSWDEMIREAEGRVDVTDCRLTNLQNAVRVLDLAKEARDVIISCHTRRMSIPRSMDVKIITSFNLEKDMLISAFLQTKNITIAELDRSRDEYSAFKSDFEICWSLVYMGYVENDDYLIQSATCPLSEPLSEIIDIAVMDTHIPISHDLPCISRRLLKEMVGLEINSEKRLNVRNGVLTSAWEEDKSCVDIELTKRLTRKMLRLYDGSRLDLTHNWRARARAKENECKHLPWK